MSAWKVFTRCEAQPTHARTPRQCAHAWNIQQTPTILTWHERRGLLKAIEVSIAYGYSPCR